MQIGAGRPDFLGEARTPIDDGNEVFDMLPPSQGGPATGGPRGPRAPVENWNSANGFIFFGKGQEISTNRQADQEAAKPRLHLLQMCLVC